jgi:hypothetical protein
MLPVVFRDSQRCAPFSCHENKRPVARPELSKEAKIQIYAEMHFGTPLTIAEQHRNPASVTGPTLTAGRKSEGSANLALPAVRDVRKMAALLPPAITNVTPALICVGHNRQHHVLARGIQGRFNECFNLPPAGAPWSCKANPKSPHNRNRL